MGSLSKSATRSKDCDFGGFMCITFLICGEKLVIVSVSPPQCSKPEVWSTIALTPSIFLSHSGGGSPGIKVLTGQFLLEGSHGESVPRPFPSFSQPPASLGLWPLSPSSESAVWHRQISDSDLCFCHHIMCGILVF